MVLGDGVEQRGCLELKRGIGILTKSARSRPGGCGVQQATVSHRPGAQKRGEQQEILQLEEVRLVGLAHALPRRSSASAYSTMRSLAIASMRRRRVARSRFSITARRTIS